MARFAKEAMFDLRSRGLKIGFIRPISLWPFPEDIFRRLTTRGRSLKVLAIEMSYGQMVEDVRLAACGKVKVEFLGRSGGGMPSVKEIIRKVTSFK